MSDDTALTAEEKKRFAEWINSKGVRACPMCGVSRWGIADHLTAPAIFRGGMIIGGQAYPHAMLICGNCGFTAFYNAVVVGLVSGVKDQKAANQVKSGGKDGTP